MRGEVGNVLVGVRARARLAGGYFFFVSAWYPFLEDTMQNKIKNNPRARAPEFAKPVHPNLLVPIFVGKTSAWTLGSARAPEFAQTVFLCFEWYGA